jgi:hypothetical protein
MDTHFCNVLLMNFLYFYVNEIFLRFVLHDNFVMIDLNYCKCTFITYLAFDKLIMKIV